MEERLQVDPITGMIKMDLDKTRMDLLPYDVLLEVGKVYTLGAKKYSDRNWEKGTSWGRPFAALMRHLSCWWQRDDKDPESGLSHLVHAAWNVLTLLAYELRGIGTDDRPNPIITTLPVVEITQRVRDYIEDFGKTIEDTDDQSVWTNRIIATEPVSCSKLGSTIGISKQRVHQIEIELTNRLIASICLKAESLRDRILLIDQILKFLGNKNE